MRPGVAAASRLRPRPAGGCRLGAVPCRRNQQCARGSGRAGSNTRRRKRPRAVGREFDNFNGLPTASNPLTLLFGPIAVPQDTPIDIGTYERSYDPATEKGSQPRYGAPTA
jgi:hypothetical protein